MVSFLLPLILGLCIKNLNFKFLYFPLSLICRKRKMQIRKGVCEGTKRSKRQNDDETKMQGDDKESEDK